MGRNLDVDMKWWHVGGSAFAGTYKCPSCGNEKAEIEDGEIEGIGIGRCYSCDTYVQFTPIVDMLSEVIEDYDDYAETDTTDNVILVTGGIAEVADGEATIIDLDGINQHADKKTKDKVKLLIKERNWEALEALVASKDALL